MLRTILWKNSASVLVLAICAGSVNAAEMNSKNPFEGGYIGIQGGFLDGEVKSVSEFQDTEFGFGFGAPESVNSNHDYQKGRIGAQVGYNQVLSNSLLVGLELSGSVLEASKSVSEDLSVGFTSGVQLESKIGSLIIGDAKFGFSNSQYAIYATAGVAGADITQSATFDVNSNTTTMSANKFGFGYVVGLGSNLMISKDTSLGVFYKYARLDTIKWDKSMSGDTSGGFGYNANLVSSEVDLQLTGITLNYHF